MAAQFDFRGNVFRDDRNVPRVRAWTAVRFADIRFERFALFDNGAMAGDADDSWRPGSGLLIFRIGVAPLGDDEFAVVTIRDAVRCEILPKVAARGFPGVGEIVVRGDAV